MQAKTRAAGLAALVGALLLEGAKHPFQFALGDSHARVLDRDEQVEFAFFIGSGRAPRGEFDVAFVGELDRVADEVQEDLPEPRLVEKQKMGQVRIDRRRKCDALFFRLSLNTAYLRLDRCVFAR